MRRVMLALAVCALLVGGLPGSASAASMSGDPVTVTGVVGVADTYYYRFSENSDPYDGLVACGNEYYDVTMTVELRSHDKQWSGGLESKTDTGGFDDPTNPAFVPCGSERFPNQYFVGTAGPLSNTAGTVRASCTGHVLADVVTLACSFALNGAPWLNANLHLVFANNDCNGELLPYEYCHDSYAVGNARAVAG